MTPKGPYVEFVRTVMERRRYPTSHSCFSPAHARAGAIKVVEGWLRGRKKRKGSHCGAGIREIVLSEDLHPFS